MYVLSDYPLNHLGGLLARLGVYVHDFTLPYLASINFLASLGLAAETLAYCGVVVPSMRKPA